MYNLLRSNYLNAFTTADKAADNAAGGVALWDLPDEMRRAFNPIILTRTKYLHLIRGSYEPSYSPVPNYIKRKNTNTIEFDVALTSSIRVCVKLTNDSYAVATVGSGRTDWTFTGLLYDIVEVTGVSFDTTLTAADYDKFKNYISDNSQIFVRGGFAYQDANFMCSVSGDVLYKNTEVDSYGINVYKTDGSYVRLVADSCYGVTKYDVAAVVKSWFNKELAEFGADNIMTDKALSIRYKLTIAGTTYTFLAVNAVAQIGEDSNMADYDEQVLTKFSRIDYYEGYPLDYAILVSSTGETQYELGELTPLSVSRVRIDNAAVELWTENDDENIEDENGNIIYILPKCDIPVYVHCNPRKPFYVRWINQLGGVDYFMFARQQKHSPSVKSVSTYEKFVESPLNAKTNSKAYSLTTANDITVGAELLNETDFQALRWIAFARKIEHWDEKLGKWIELSVSKFDGSYNTKNETHTVEVTFSLPNINVQY